MIPARFLVIFLFIGTVTQCTTLFQSAEGISLRGATVASGSQRFTRAMGPSQGFAVVGQPGIGTLAGEQTLGMGAVPVILEFPFSPPEFDHLITHVFSPENGKIAVRLNIPKQPRYPEGAPVVVNVATFLTPRNGFTEAIPATKIGAISVSYLWPGETDPTTGAASDGVYDYAGPLGMAALRDVVKFASGLIPDVSGTFITDYAGVTPLTDNVGLYAFSHPGIAATNLLAIFGTELPRVRYFVGGENPTLDALTAVEVGHWGEGNVPIQNPYYRYPADYSAVELFLDYSRVSWLQNAEYSEGRPFFEVTDGPDYILGDRVPRMWGKRYYSVALTRALVDNVALDPAAWPADLATVTDTLQHWPPRSTVHHYPMLATSAAELKVLLHFAERDHVQPALDKPHIHHAYDGFGGTANLWVRLNPDLVYVREVDPRLDSGFPDNPANWEPPDWSDMRPYSYPKPPGLGDVNKTVGLAGLAEMADRVHTGIWDDDLETVLVGPTSTTTPSPTMGEPTPTRRPIYVTLNIHGHNFSDSIPPDQSESEYVRHHAEVIWLLDRANLYGAKLSFQMAGEYAEWADSLADQAHLNDYLTSGHAIGAHFHPQVRTSTRTWVTQGGASLTPEITEQIWSDNVTWVERAVRAVSPTYECRRIDAVEPIWDNPTRHVLMEFHNGLIEAAPEDHLTGFEGFTKFAHHVWNPFRRMQGELLEEDLMTTFVDLPFYPQIGGALPGGGTMGRHAGFIATVDHLKRHILMIYVQWLAQERFGLTDRIWTVGWNTHPDQGSRHRSQIEEMLEWLNDLITDTTNRHGSPAFQYATDEEVYQQYLRWELDHPGESHFDYADGEPYPYSFPVMGEILEPYAYKRDLVTKDKGSNQVHLHELVWGATADIVGATPLYWAWVDDGTEIIDLSPHLTDPVFVQNGYGDTILSTPDSLTVGEAPIFVRDAEAVVPTVSPTPHDYDIAPDPPDGEINARDLLALLAAIKAGLEEEVYLLDFSKFWKSVANP